MPRANLLHIGMNAPGRGRGRPNNRDLRAQRRNAVRAQTLKAKRKLLANKKKAAVKKARDKYGNVWKMRKGPLIAKFNNEFGN